MIGARGSWFAATLATLAFGLAAGEAPASERSVEVTMRTAASNDFKFLLGVEAKPGTRPAFVSLWKESDEEAQGAFYRVAGAGTFRNRRIDLDLGALGSARARFVQSEERRRVRHYGKRCSEVTVVHLGRFEGRIDVEGENGFAAVHRSRIRGRIESYRIRGCGTDRVRRSPARFARRLGRAPAIRHPALTSCGADRETWYGAFRGSLGTEYAATYSTRAGGIRAIRIAFSTGSRDSFHVAPRGNRATVRPDARFFAGTGRYRAGRLTGDLTASFPGAADTPLTPGRANFGDEDSVPPGRCYPFSGA